MALILGVHALRSYLKLFVNMSFMAYQIKELVAERIMVETTSRSNRRWSAIFCVIVYFTTTLCTFLGLLDRCNMSRSKINNTKIKKVASNCIYDKIMIRCISKCHDIRCVLRFLKSLWNSSRPSELSPTYLQECTEVICTLSVLSVMLHISIPSS